MIPILSQAKAKCPGCNESHLFALVREDRLFTCDCPADDSVLCRSARVGRTLPQEFCGCNHHTLRFVAFECHGCSLIVSGAGSNREWVQMESIARALGMWVDTNGTIYTKRKDYLDALA